MIEVKITANDGHHLQQLLRGMLSAVTADADSAALKQEYAVTGAATKSAVKEGVKAPQASAPAVEKLAGTPASTTSEAPSDTSQQTQTPATTTVADGGAPGASPSDEAPDNTQLPIYKETVKPAVLRVSQKHGRQGVETLLAKFGIGHVKDLDPARYDELLAEIETMMAEG